ncbi:MAG: transcriptional regulator [Nocardioidaceae bacterium]|nr:transcriptional regulator [Nocardioidaceae bacterium]
MSDPPRGQVYEAFGAYVRNQRKLARLTLRQAAGMARISNPYLSQIEHGLALPSVTVLRGLADALEVSTASLLLRAAGVVGDDESPHGSSATEEAIRHDARLDEGQKHALLAVLGSFVGTSAAVPSASSPPSVTNREPPEGGGDASKPAKSSESPESPEPSAPRAPRAPRRRRPPKATPRDEEVQNHD